MKMRVTRAFNSDALKVLNLNSKKKSSLIDFISTLPELTTKAATRGNILHGFYESGLIDRTKSRYHVLLKILGTCHSMLPKELCQKSLTNLRTCTSSCWNKAGFLKMSLMIWSFLGTKMSMDLKC